MLGTVETCFVTDQNDTSYFVQYKGRTFDFPKQLTENSYQIGDMVKGFLYENMDHHYIFSPILPDILPGQYGWAVVKDVRKDLGVFCDIGLPDKDVVVSKDLLSEMTSLWPKKGNKLLITITTDKEERIWGELADEQLVHQLAKKAPDSMINKDIEATVVRLKKVGTYVLTSEFYWGFIHPSERFNEPTLGELITGRVIAVKEDGSLNISLKPRAFEAIPDDAQMILTLLNNVPTHQLPYHDKSDPDDIKSFFGISKGQFKSAIGHLLKTGQVIKIPNGIALKK